MWKIASLVLAGFALSAVANKPAAPLKKASENPGGGTGPAIVMIIRHGEKPDTAGDPNLAPKGFERAKALAQVIPAHFPKPDFLFATKKSKGSVRPIETIAPLSQTLNETIDEDFSADQVAALANDVLTNPKYNGKVVLIAWHHGEIPELAKDLGATDAPKDWNSKVFDRVWELTYTGGAVKFADLPEKALPGDSTN